MRKKILTKIKDIEKIAREISKIRNVKAIYLFGSQASKKAGPLSDIDICIIGNLTKNQEEKVLKFSSENLDISFFNKLPIMIKFRVLREGKPLIIKDKKFIDSLKISTIKKYFDFKYIINKYCDEILKCTI